MYEPLLALIDCIASESAQVDLAHFATHGYFANEVLRVTQKPNSPDRLGVGMPIRTGGISRNPMLLSGIALSGANRHYEVEDDEAADTGIITAQTISLLPLENLHLAVLSACDTGLGDITNSGEGVLGLQRAFHIAGARNVIATLWKVDDRATVVFMQLFYHHLIQERHSPATALRMAQATLNLHPEYIEHFGEPRGRIDFSATVPVKSTPRPADLPERRTHPRYWAAFTLSGAGN